MLGSKPLILTLITGNIRLPFFVTIISLIFPWNLLHRSFSWRSTRMFMCGSTKFFILLECVSIFSLRKSLDNWSVEGNPKTHLWSIRLGGKSGFWVTQASAAAEQWACNFHKPQKFITPWTSDSFFRNVRIKNYFYTVMLRHVTNCFFRLLNRVPMPKGMLLLLFLQQHCQIS